MSTIYIKKVFFTARGEWSEIFDDSARKQMIPKPHFMLEFPKVLIKRTDSQS